MPKNRVVINEDYETTNAKLSFVISRNKETDKTSGVVYLVVGKYFSSIDKIETPKFLFEDCDITEISSGNLDSSFSYVIDFKELTIDESE